ncbi:ApaG domain [Macleaya cordata]|uniref:ApaG domain n=1 Tax=Macleaya cordata TaxID=56857 RepID=A0A200QKW9_MACCD|nr:ApaG domain [Macleaya cordata]
MASLEGLGDLALHVIVSKLSPKDAAVLACVNKRLRLSASEEIIWLNFCFQDLDLSSPQDPFGNPTPSFKATYQIWREVFGMYPWSLVKRVKRCWGSLKNWMAVNFPEVGNTLRKGASEADIKEVEDSLGVKLPISTKVLYRLCDGQGIKSKNSSGTELRGTLGLIGGYSFYDHLVNVRLLPLSQVIKKTKEFVRHLGFSSRSRYIVVAASTTYSEKLFFLNCTNGQLYVGTRNLSTDGEMIPCVPSTLIRSVHDLDNGEPQDAMLLWLEEHSRRLHSGLIHLREEGQIRSINLFPEAPPFCSTAVTHGVQIRASAVFVPELSDLQEESEKYWFAYSVRMSLLKEGCILNGMSFNSCQLYWRHWVIRASDVVVSDVNGEAVIGKYPLLCPDGKEFVYESCTPLPSSSGSIEGSFTFVPGRLTNPKSSQFDVQVAKFPLQLPDYIF